MIRPKYQSTEYLLDISSGINSTWILNKFTKGLKQNPKVLSVCMQTFTKK
jgi:hypothetical protein